MKKYIIYPSLLALADRKTEWKQEIQKVASLSTGIHYDIGDGEFVPSLMLDPCDIGLVGAEYFLPGVQDIEPLRIQLPIDVHLMVKKPSEYFPKLLEYSSVAAVAFHVESDEDIHQNIQVLKNAGMKVGLAILHTTPADHLDQYLLEIDYLIVMTVKGGYSGTPFLPEVLSKITELHNKNPELPLIVDGGINRETLELCISAGATGAVMSSALFSGEDISWLFL